MQLQTSNIIAEECPDRKYCSLEEFFPGCSTFWIAAYGSIIVVTIVLI